MNNKDRQLYDLRNNYSKARLNKQDVLAEPLMQFDKWFEEALDSKVYEVNAMTLSTIQANGVPASRIVLLKKMRKDGFVFFTNYRSDKARQLEQNPFCSLVFLWHELERQVRVEGVAEKISDGESDEYFLSRPRESQLGAWASPQSAQIRNRRELEEKATAVEKQFQNKDIERPEFWGGYVVKPQMVEFWQGRPGRLHDRIRYSLHENQWKISRLAP